MQTNLTKHSQQTFKYLALACLLFCSTQLAANEAITQAGFKLPSQSLVAPNFKLQDFQNKSYELKQFQGKLVIVHFWATWCVPCRKELPLLEILWQHFKNKGLVILAINVDRSNLKKVNRLIDDLKLNMPVPLDPKGTARNQYEIEAFPTSYLVGKNGKFLGKRIGSSDWSLGHFEKILQSVKGASNKSK